MATGLTTPLGIAGLILIIIGIIMAVVGIILLLANQNRPKPWYVWFLLITGVVLGIAGGVMAAIALSDRPDEKHVIVHTSTLPAMQYAQPITQPVMYYPPAPGNTVQYPANTMASNIYPQG